jgi:hypothetical protein
MKKISRQILVSILSISGAVAAAQQSTDSGLRR